MLRTLSLALVPCSVLMNVPDGTRTEPVSFEALMERFDDEAYFAHGLEPLSDDPKNVPVYGVFKYSTPEEEEGELVKVVSITNAETSEGYQHFVGGLLARAAERESPSSGETAHQCDIIGTDDLNGCSFGPDHCKVCKISPDSTESECPKEKFAWKPDQNAYIWDKLSATD